MRVLSKKTLALFTAIFMTASLCLPSVSAFAKGGDAVNEFVNNNADTAEITYISSSFDGEYNKYLLNCQEDNIYEWGSGSSLLVWIAIMQLKEQGKLNLTDSVTNYLSDEYNEAISIGYPITIENLMNHTAGFQQNMYDVMVTGEDIAKFNGLETILIDNVPRQIYTPGQTVAYSDYGITLAAYIVECVSGMSYDEYVKNNIFAPLDIEHTSLKPDCSDNDWVKENIDSDLFSGNRVNFSPYYPAYMVAGTAYDINAIIADICSDKPVLFSASTRDEFLSPTLKYHDSEVTRNAHGLFGYEYGTPVVGMQSSGINRHSFDFYIDPDTKNYLIISSGEYNEKLFNLGLTEELFGKAYTEEQKGDLSTYKSIYISSNTITKGKLSFYNLLGVLKLKASSDGNLYYANDPTPYFTAIADDRAVMRDGTVVHLYKTTDLYRRIELSHMEFMEFSPFTYYLETIILILQLLGYVFASGLLFFALLRVLYLLIKKDYKKGPAFRKYLYIQCGNITLFSWFFMIMAVQSMAYASANLVNSGSMMYWVGTLISLIYVAFFIKTGSKEKASGFEKGLYIATLVFSFVEVMFAIMFQLIM